MPHALALALSPNARPSSDARTSFVVSASLDVTSGEDYDTPTVVITMTNYTPAASPTVTVGGVTATSITRSAYNQITCDFPARILAATADTLAVDVVIDGFFTASNAYTYNWTRYSLQVPWYRADLGLTVDGSSKVTAWADSSGIGTTLTGSASATYVATLASINNKPSVLFNSTLAQITGSITPITTAVSIGSVAVANAAPGTDCLVNLLAAGTAKVLQLNLAGSLFSYSDPSSVNGPAWTGAASVVSEVTGTTITNYVNSRTAGASGAGPAFVTLTNIELGNNGGAAQGFDGHLADLFIAPRILSANEKNRDAAYVNRLYSLVVAP
jgi:hypothetical protein